jgi:hypothetical protein
MKLTVVVALAALGMSLAGCAYQVQTVSAPQLNVYSNYTDKVPGKWALIVDDSAFNQTVHSEGLSCAAHSFPLDLTTTFKQSVIGTFQNIVGEVEVMDHPLPMDGLAAGGYNGQIEIKADNMSVRLNLIPGFWSAKADADLELDAGLIATGTKARLVGTRASGRGHESSDAGSMCSGATVAIGHAAESAMKDLLGELGERFSNAPQVRPASTH